MTGYRWRAGDPDRDAAIAAERAADQAHRVRRPVRVPSKRKPGDPIDHGTDAGWQQELTRGMEHCQPCKDAHNRKNKAWKAGRKAQLENGSSNTGETR